MADLSDVSNALVTTIAGIVYPNGTGAGSITGDPVKIYAGWPNAKQLTDDLAAGMVHVSIFPRPGDKVTITNHGDWDEVTNNGTTGTAQIELRRQTRQYQITIWANCFDKRDPVAATIDAGLAGLSRLAMPDGTRAVLAYVNSSQIDDQQKAGIYRRDLFYAANYATTQTITATPIATINITTTAQFNGAIPTP